MTITESERDDLRTTARAMLERTVPSDRLRRVIADEDGTDRRLWAQVVELGWTSIHVDERLGGGGGGFSDLAVVLHELGRVLAPTPFLASAVLATGALMLADRTPAVEAMLQDLCAGTSVGTAALANSQGSYDPALATVRWRPVGGALRLDGEAALVLDADMADLIVVAAADDDGGPAVVAIDAGTPGLDIRRTPTVDETRRLFAVAFDGVAVPRQQCLREPGRAAATFLERLVAIAVVGAAIDATGAAERQLWATADYARVRTQFGKPIGAFQAVKHLCADMAIAVEASGAAVAAAAAVLDGDPDRWPEAAAIVASYVGPACSRSCGLAMRVHGGIGFTWEHDTHLFMKRVKLDEMLFGSPAWHRRRLADRVFPALAGA